MMMIAIEIMMEVNQKYDVEKEERVMLAMMVMMVMMLIMVMMVILLVVTMVMTAMHEGNAMQWKSELTFMTM